MKKRYVDQQQTKGKSIVNQTEEKMRINIEEMRKVEMGEFTGHIEFHYNNGKCSRVKEVKWR